nr:MAG TPA: hypothetical protein [Caudoviricetes sp.]
MGIRLCPQINIRVWFLTERLAQSGQAKHFLE